MIKISNTIPPVYSRCKAQFGVDWDRGIIMTYGDTVHTKFPLSPDLVVHEATHVKQQIEMGKELWWDRYFTDVEFRLSQEVEAYRNQLKFIDANYNRNGRRVMRAKIIKDMSTIYGSMCTPNQAAMLMA